jgi:hypothetical protein
VSLGCPSHRSPPAVLSTCPAEEYADFVSSCSRSVDKKGRLLRRHERFVRQFPELSSWFDQPLRQRLGWRNHDTQRQRLAPGEGFDVTAGWINYNAREYVIYLALTGRMQLDWGWLLGIGVLKPWWISDDLGLPLTAQIQHVQHIYSGLGRTPADSDYRLSWALLRLVLHRGDPDLTAITFGDVEDLRATIRRLEEIPGLDEVLNAEHLTTTRNVWGTSAFRAGVALFHAGVTNELPARLEPKPRAALSNQSRIAAVLDRYPERTSTHRATREHGCQPAPRCAAWVDGWPNNAPISTLWPN